MTYDCTACHGPVDATAVIWVYDSPYCLTCYMDYADIGGDEKHETDESIAKSDNTSAVVGVAR